MVDVGGQSLPGGGGGAGPWQLPELEPTNLIALWPDDRPPTITEIIRALRAHLGDDVRRLEELPPDDPSVAWCVAVKLPVLEAPIVFWTEPAQPIPLDELAELSGRAFSWVLGVETLLDARDPLTDFINLLSSIGGALPDVPAVLDVNTARWHTRRELDEVFASEEIEPPADVLWIIQAVQAMSDSDAGEGAVWLHTHGLWRCGVPELEMLEVPADRAEAAAELIDDVASLLLAHPPPPPGDPMEIGTDLRVVFQPWHAVAPYVADGAPGGMAERADDEDNAHVGVRAVVCADEPVGRYRQLWVWPREVVERLSRDEAGVYMTLRATERQAKLARAGWGHLATAFASAAQAPPDPSGEPAALFGVKAGFADDDDETSREHLWFQALAFNADKVRGRLVNQPLAVQALRRGDELWIDREQVSDWRVMTSCGCYGPNDIAALWRAVDDLKRKGTTP
jgi:hypothetical protein